LEGWAVQECTEGREGKVCTEVREWELCTEGREVHMYNEEKGVRFVPKEVRDRCLLREGRDMGLNGYRGSLWTVGRVTVVYLGEGKAGGYGGMCGTVVYAAKERQVCT